MQQWEFLFVELHPSVGKATYLAEPGEATRKVWKPVADLGVEGWELVSVWYMSRASGSPTYAAFKRPLEVQESKPSGGKK